MLNRQAFLTAALAATSAAATPAGAQTPVAPAPKKVGKALILTGGINRGAYQAGVVVGMARAAGLKDGEPLDYEIVTGASIGALNAYLVATAQYSKLEQVWREVGSRNVLRLKRKYDPLMNANSGVITRLFTVVGLAGALTHNVTGLLDPEPIRHLLRDYVDPSLPTLIPLSFNSTNLSRTRLEIFMRPATGALGQPLQARVDALLKPHFRVKPHVVSDDVLRSALFSSAALPVLFDPIEIPREDDPTVLDQYVDGGLTDDVPVVVAGAVSHTLQVLAVDPPPAADGHLHFPNAAGVGTQVFSIMQSEIIRYAAGLTYLSHIVSGQNAAQLQARGYPVDASPIVIEMKRPVSLLPGELGDFNDTASNIAMFEIGVKDALRKWTEITELSQL